MGASPNPSPESTPDPRRDAVDVLTAEFTRKIEEIQGFVHMLTISYTAADGNKYYRTRNFSESSTLLEILFAYILKMTPFDFEALQISLLKHPAFANLRNQVKQLNDSSKGSVQ